MEKTLVRIKDIATKAGVSVGTVDRVLHNRGRVSPEAKTKVKAALKELNYRPNFIARALGASKKYCIAVLVPDPNNDPYWTEPYNGITQAEHDFNSHGIIIDKYTFNQFDPVSFTQQAKLLLKKAYDGILLAPLFYQQYLLFAQDCVDRKIPLILFNTNIDNFSVLSYIGQDSYQSGRLAAHLLYYPLRAFSGKVIIMHLAEDPESAAQLMKKEKGFKDYFENDTDKPGFITLSVNTPVQKTLIAQLDSTFNVYHDISAIFVTTSKAYEIAAYLEAVGLSHILLIGFDMVEENVNYLEKGVIDFIINQNAYQQGYAGVARFVDHLILKKEVQPKMYLPLDVITKENFHYYLH
ncbi:MAG: LacI family DNA-binding transcriptional regulator [Bacteroidota bacterium]